MSEIWIEIEDAKGYYVSNLGRFKSPNKFLTPTPDSNGYAEAALDNVNVFDEFGTLSTENNTTKTIPISSFSNAGRLAPYAVSNGQTWFAFGAANSDGIDHFKSFGTNSFGLEDWNGGGDKDYDDFIMKFDFSSVT